MEKIRKAGALIFYAQKMLIVKPRGKPFYINPGGKYEIKEGREETAAECLARELEEELNVQLGKYVFYNTYEVEKAAHSNIPLSLDLFLVEHSGEIIPSGEIESVEWMSRQDFLGKKYNLAPSFNIFVEDLMRDDFL